MAKRKIDSSDAKHAKEHGKKLVAPNSYLETQKAHKKWYSIWEMGKQRGKPHSNPSNVRKPSGTRKHSLRKEK